MLKYFSKEQSHSFGIVWLNTKFQDPRTKPFRRNVTGAARRRCEKRHHFVYAMYKGSACTLLRHIQIKNLPFSLFIDKISCNSWMFLYMHTQDFRRSQGNFTCNVHEKSKYRKWCVRHGFVLLVWNLSYQLIGSWKNSPNTAS